MPDSSSPTQPITDDIALPKQPAISQTTIHGWWSVGVGLPVVAAGIWLSALSLDWIPTPDDRFGVPRQVTALLGVSFALCGLSLMVNGIVGLVRRARMAAVAGAPWALDYAWDSQGIRSRSSFWRNVMGIVLTSVFLVPFNGLMLSPTPGDPLSSSVGGFMTLIILFFDLLIVVSLVYTFYLAAKDWKYGRSFLQFRRFPFFLGEPLEADLQIEKPGAVPFSVCATLRFIEERFEKQQRGSNQASVVVSYQVYAVSALLPGLAKPQHRGTSLRVSFPLPEGDQYETGLGERPAKYWELTATSDNPEVDYRAAFLVPVYARE